MTISSSSWVLLFENNGWWFDDAFPADVSGKIGDLTKAGFIVRDVVFDPRAADAWLIVCMDNAWYCNNTADSLNNEITALINAGHVIRSVTIGPKGGDQWIIICEDNAWVANNFPGDAFNQVGDLVKNGYKLSKVVFGPRRDDTWLIICDNNGYVAHGLPQAAFDKIEELSKAGVVLKSFTFSPDNFNAWLIIGEGNAWYVSADFPRPVVDRLGSMLSAGFRVTSAVFGPAQTQPQQSPVVRYQDGRGYWFCETSDWWKGMCANLPCFPELQWPDYATKYYEVNLKGEPAVIQVWKGWCQKFLNLNDFPGGVGGEVGVYRRMPGRPLPTAFPGIPEPLASIILHAIKTVGPNDIWWPAPDLADSVSFTFVNPENNNSAFFDSGAEKTYWNCKWMELDSYSQYQRDQGKRWPWAPDSVPGNSKTPLLSTGYTMRFSVNGQNFDW
jgi:hypothetical protein